MHGGMQLAATNCDPPLPAPRYTLQVTAKDGKKVTDEKLHGIVR